MTRLRIAVFGVSQEAMIAAPGFLDPATVQTVRGDAMRDADLWIVRGVVARLAEEPDVEIVPLIAVRCRASAAFARPHYDAVKAEILQLLRDHGPFDGVVAANHGALEVEGLAVSGDTDLLASVRAVLGEAVPMSVALDLHGHITPSMLRSAQNFSAFRTAPHRDDARTGRAAAEQLLRILRDGIRPRIAAVRIPLFLPGEFAMTTFSPARELYAALDEIDALPGVLESNIMVGFAWNDRPWIAMTATVATDNAMEDAKHLALDLAARIWAVRGEFRLQIESFDIEAGLAEAARSAQHPVYVSDSGDNVTAGAHGDLTFVLQAALAMPELRDIVVVNIVAPDIVRRCVAAGVGATVALEIGGEHVSRPPAIREAVAVVEALGGPFVGNLGQWARVRIGHVTATFHSQRLSITAPEQLEAMGIHPTAHAVYVFKVGYLHPGLEDVGPRHILLRSDGTANLDLSRLRYEQIARPAYPFDADMHWTPEMGLFTSEP